jgi:hypothetical protein
MKYAENFHRITAYSIGDDIRCISDHQFAGTGDPAGAAHGRVIRQMSDAFFNCCDDSPRRSRIIACDVLCFAI